MSILIKGMEMPTKGYRLLLVNADGTVQTTSGETTAVHIPPHGKLKDYDRIMKEYDEWFSKTESHEYENMFYALRMAINGSPTVIPAERANDG